MRQFLALAHVIALGGCIMSGSPHEPNAAAAQLRAAQTAYTDCLRQNPQNVAACESTRLIYETNLRTYEAQYGRRPQ